MDQVQQYASPEMPDRDNPLLLTSAIAISTIASAGTTYFFALLFTYRTLSYKMVLVLFISPVKS